MEREREGILRRMRGLEKGGGKVMRDCILADMKTAMALYLSWGL
jgi:hypothetical protein